MLSSETRKTATPRLVNDFDRLYLTNGSAVEFRGEGNDALRSLIDNRPYDPDNCAAVFDHLPPSQGDPMKLYAIVGTLALFATLCFAAVYFQ